jgi:hypothetical protein
MIPNLTRAAIPVLGAMAWVFVSSDGFGAQAKLTMEPQDTGAILENRTDGSTVVHSGGSRFIRYPSGYGGEMKPDGSVDQPMPLVEILPGGTVIQIFGDGTKIDALPEGTRILRWPDKNGFTRYADGSGTRDFPDGSMTEVKGTIDILPDATVEMNVDARDDLYTTQFLPDGTQNEISWWTGPYWKGRRPFFSSAKDYLDDEKKQQTPVIIPIQGVIQRADVDGAGTPAPMPGGQPAQRSYDSPVWINPYGTGYGFRERAYDMQSGEALPPILPPGAIPPAGISPWTVPPSGIPPGGFLWEIPAKKGTPWEIPPKKK